VLNKKPIVTQNYLFKTKPLEFSNPLILCKATFHFCQGSVERMMMESTKNTFHLKAANCPVPCSSQHMVELGWKEVELISQLRYKFFFGPDGIYNIRNK
jgi:hypothetical protein